MKCFGLDIGTTKITISVLNDEGVIEYENTVLNAYEREKEQSPEKIFTKCSLLIEEAEKRCGKADYFGISNQMHGILYVDKDGKALSNLYTWQDEKGNLPYKDTTYAQYIGDKTGYIVRSGYGIVTHFYLLCNNSVPVKGEKLYTIGDYVEMRLQGKKQSVMHPSNAAAIGCYDVKNDCFDIAALDRIGISTDILPEVNYDNDGVLAVGDNQASYMGAVFDWDNSALINIGTGSQISLLTEKTESIFGELRPFIKGKRLLTGVARCGGYAYNLLANFFISVANLFGVKDGRNIFELMNKNARTETQTRFDTTFYGDFSNPNKRASFYNITEAEFTAGDMILACQTGIVRELEQLYKKFEIQREKLIATGGVIKKNPSFSNIIEEIFGVKPEISCIKEEAAIGACLYVLRNAKEKNFDHAMRNLRRK